MLQLCCKRLKQDKETIFSRFPITPSCHRPLLVQKQKKRTKIFMHIANVVCARRPAGRLAKVSGSPDRGLGRRAFRTYPLDGFLEAGLWSTSAAVHLKMSQSFVLRLKWNTEVGGNKYKKSEIQEEDDDYR